MKFINWRSPGKTMDLLILELTLGLNSRTHHGYLGSLLWQKKQCYKHPDAGLYKGSTKFIPANAPWLYLQRSTQNPNRWRHSQIALCHWVVAIGKTIGVITKKFICQFVGNPTAETNHGTQAIWCASCVRGLCVLYDLSQ